MLLRRLAFLPHKHRMSPTGPYSYERVDSVCRENFVIPGKYILLEWMPEKTQDCIIAIYKDPEATSVGYDLQSIDCVRYNGR